MLSRGCRLLASVALTYRPHVNEGRWPMLSSASEKLCLEPHLHSKALGHSRDARTLWADVTLTPGPNSSLLRRLSLLASISASNNLCPSSASDLQLTAAKQSARPSHLVRLEAGQKACCALEETHTPSSSSDHISSQKSALSASVTGFLSGLGLDPSQAASRAALRLLVGMTSSTPFSLLLPLTGG